MNLGGLPSIFALFLAGLALCQPARASELFPRVIFTEDRQFFIQAPQRATEITDPTMPVRALVFDSAIQSCKLDLERARGALSLILDAKSSLWTTLDKLFQNSREQVRNRAITVTLDDFSEFPGNGKAFASTYVRGGIISLDCSRLSRGYWLPSLAHEFAHALLEDRDVESGWEEGLAQLLEKEAGGTQPERTLQHLRTAKVLPPVVEASRPLPSRESYAMAYLFASYVRQAFGGWETLRAMTFDRSTECESPDFLSRAACNGRKYLEAAPSASALGPASLSAEKMTRNGLLRYFTMALAMNNPKSRAYFIHGWDGVSEIPDRLSTRTLQPGQAAVFKRLSSFNPGLEVYRVLIDAGGRFKILPLNERLDAARDFSAVSDFVLVLNLQFHRIDN